MAPTKRKLENTNVGEEVLDLVIPNIHNVDDRNSVSLVSRKCYATDGITRKRLTVHTLYYPNPASLSKRFPFIESLTLKGPPLGCYGIHITPWIQQLALEFRCLKELHIRRLVVHDEDLEKLGKTCGKDLRSLKIMKCTGFSTDGLRHVSNYCNQLRTLCLKFTGYFYVKDGSWLRQLALNSTVLERLHFMNTDFSDAEDLTLLAKNCCNSLILLKIGDCYLSKLADAFRYAVRLEHFGGINWDEESELVGVQFPPNMHSLSIEDLPVTRWIIIIGYPSGIGVGSGLDIINGYGYGFTKTRPEPDPLPSLLAGISNEALECIGTYLKNLRKFHMKLYKNYGTTDLPLDNGIQAMLMGCSKLERLDISLWHGGGFWCGGLTDVGLEYIAKYGANLRSLSLNFIGNSNAGLIKLSEGCPRLRKLELMGYPYSKQVVASSAFNIPSLRYVWGCKIDLTGLALTRPEFQL